MKRNKDYFAARRKRLKAAGLCDCGKPALEGARQCLRCRAYHARYRNEHAKKLNRSKRRKRDEKRKQGICIHCSQPARDGLATCASCAAIASVAAKRYRAKPEVLERSLERWIERVVADVEDAQ